MNSSAGAPLSICFAKVELAAYEIVASLPLSRCHSAAIASSAVLRLAAAKTRTGPLFAGKLVANDAAANTATVLRTALRGHDTRFAAARRGTGRQTYLVIPAKAGIHDRHGSRL